jgi:hypothetical protein
MYSTLRESLLANWGGHKNEFFLSQLDHLQVYEPWPGHGSLCALSPLLIIAISFLYCRISFQNGESSKIKMPVDIILQE